jgi:hypothetical protein
VRGPEGFAPLNPPTTSAGGTEGEAQEPAKSAEESPETRRGPKAKSKAQEEVSSLGNSGADEQARPITGDEAAGGDAGVSDNAADSGDMERLPGSTADSGVESVFDTLVRQVDERLAGVPAEDLDLRYPGRDRLEAWMKKNGLDPASGALVVKPYQHTSGAAVYRAQGHVQAVIAARLLLEAPVAFLF